MKVLIFLLIVSTPTYFIWRWVFKSRIKDGAKRKVFTWLATLIISPILIFLFIGIGFIIANYDSSKSFTEQAIWQDPKENNIDTSIAKIIKVKTYYSEDKITRVSEMKIDSVLDGLSVWYDSLGRKTGEQNYKAGVKNGIGKTYNEKGHIIEEMEYLKGKEISYKLFSSHDGILILQRPIDKSSIGKMQVLFSADTSRKYFIRNIDDTIIFNVKNLPVCNRAIKTVGAKLRPADSPNGRYIIYDIKKQAKNIKIILSLDRQNGSHNDELVDSISIPVK